MLKIAMLAMGLLAVVTIAPNAESTNFQLNRARSDVNGQLHAEKLVPIKKSVKLAPTIIKATSAKVPIDRKQELSPAYEGPQPVTSVSQQEFKDLNWLRPNERSISIWSNSKDGKGFSGFGNFYNFNR